VIDQSRETFELIDLDSGNVLSDFDSVEQALESICNVASTQGWPKVQRLSLMRVKGDDQEIVAMKEGLATLARSAERAPTTAEAL
jgi:hypothetical protein